jgi:hypothetical protein
MKRLAEKSAIRRLFVEVTSPESQNLDVISIQNARFGGWFLGIDEL